MWHRLYKCGSSLEGGTLQQLRNLINRRNIGAKSTVVGHVNDFLNLIIRCHVVAAAMHFFSMGSIDDEPHTSVFPANIATIPLDERKKFFMDRLRQIVDTYIIPKQFALETSSECTVETLTQPRNPHEQRVVMEHSYFHSEPPVTRRLPHTITGGLQRTQASKSIRQMSVDGVFNYASAVLNDGMLLLEFCDAIKEGDGKWILRCWKAMLIYFQHARHSNYAKEAILLLAAVNATATPRVAAQITWSRVVNTRGGPGNNIPVDLHNEHLNHALKTAVSCMGANVATNTILQCGKGLMQTVDNFDAENELHPVSTRHTHSSLAKDEDTVLEELVDKSHVFDYVPGRQHRTFHPLPQISLLA